MEQERTRRKYCQVQSCAGNFRTVRVHGTRSDPSGREVGERKMLVSSYPLTNNSSARQPGRGDGVRNFLAHHPAPGVSYVVATVRE